LASHAARNPSRLACNVEDLRDRIVFVPLRS
jgi:hypothetical protein